MWRKRYAAPWIKRNKTMPDILLACDNLHKSYNDKTVLKDLTLRVRRGEVVGLLGLNGAGKTTLLECLLGFSLPDKGAVQICGHDALQLDDDTRLCIGFVPQRDELLDAMGPQQYLDLVGSFYPNWNRNLVQRLSREWQVPETDRIGTLSIGQRQKLSIISALGNEPQLLLLDEPVASLDPVARRQFIKELVEIASDHNSAIVFSTHIVSDLERVATRVWLLQNGRMAIDSELDTLKEQVVRIQLPPGATVPLSLQAKLLHQHTQNGGQVLLCRDWDDSLALEAGAVVEHLSLEEIFVELHA
jgi:ABC-2 type transport system ATP-binding protein